MISPFERAVAVVRDMLLILVLVTALVIGYATLSAMSKVNQPQELPWPTPTPTHFKTKGEK